MANRAMGSGQSALARELAKEAEARFAGYEAEASRIAAMPHVANGKRFAMTAEAQRAAASVRYISLIGGE